MEINMEWYRVFYWVAKMGSLSKAAEKLHITQPAVTHTLKQLESRIGGTLFFRMPKGVKLTVEGEVLFTYVQQAIGFLDTGEKKLSEMHDLQLGEIRISASDTLCEYYLLPILEKYHQQYPEIQIRVMNRTTPETIALLKEGKIDFGIINLPVADSKIDIRRSSAQQDCLVGGKAYAHLANEGLDWEKLRHFPLLLLEQGGSSRSYIDEYARSHGVELVPEFELGSLRLLTQFARSGFGLAFVIQEYVVDELIAGNLIEIPIRPQIPSRHIGIATLSGVPISAAARKLMELLP